MEPQTLSGTIVTTSFNGSPLRFFVVTPEDRIQMHHVEGQFYEQEELAIIARHFPKGGVYLDIGANIGNHILFVAKSGLASQIIAVEPGQEACEILRVNLLLNEVSADLRHLGFALGEKEERGNLFQKWLDNIGDVRLTPAEGGTTPIVPGDIFFSDRQVHFIKMDVEGFELMALAGLSETISRWRPIIFVEVEDTNRGGFELWLLNNRYEIAERYRRYHVNENFLIRPVER